MLGIFLGGRRSTQADTSAKVSYGRAFDADKRVEAYYRSQPLDSSKYPWADMRTLGAFAEIRGEIDKLQGIILPVIQAARTSGGIREISKGDIKVTIDCKANHLELLAIKNGTAVSLDFGTGKGLSLVTMDDTRDRLMSLFRGAIDLVQTAAKSLPKK